MRDKNEIVTVGMVPIERLRLYGQITAQMEKLGYNLMDYSQLNLGFELPATWPVNENTQPTLAQLIAIAVKLKSRLVISNIYFEPRNEPQVKTENGSGEKG